MPVDREATRRAADSRTWPTDPGTEASSPADGLDRIDEQDVDPRSPRRLGDGVDVGLGEHQQVRRSPRGGFREGAAERGTPPEA
jgi:hypothetical protein